MTIDQKTLRSFVTAEGKLMVCNEPFFTHFGHCTQHLIGKSVNEIFSAFDSHEIMQAVQCCQKDPQHTVTIEMEKNCKEGGCCFRWIIYAELQQGRVTGIHLVGEVLASAKAA